ncbi:hypothetical protein GCK72_007117 [Caenorhabditis remanei]|uniref:PAN-3 domain-containing protein n=1 Tax=Caenorhabditis remanei TaxID=31234 RepID=A0A6A5HH50_CAERE|nr:hypothetical protein GCK72_007117 [Caenorhabditis remanei]KAF1767158.1 hypothetical protein GCK72_007117 [Caenorhabditis remanei]
MSSYSLLLLLAFYVKISVDSVMIVTRGTPEVYVDSISLELIWEECLTNCTQNDLCVAVHTIGDGNCQIFEFGDLQTVKRSNDIESKFAYKVKNENASTCPADDTVGETVQEFRFFSETLLACCLYPIVSEFHHRNKWDFWSSRQAAARRWFNASYPLYAVWISGVKKPECVGNASCQGLSAFSFADPTLSANPTGYLFNTGKPDGTGEDCLAFRVNSDRTCGIDNVQCDQGRTSDNSTCLNGVVCGFPPT